MTEPPTNAWEIEVRIAGSTQPSWLAAVRQEPALVTTAAAMVALGTLSASFPRWLLAAIAGIGVLSVCRLAWSFRAILMDLAETEHTLQHVTTTDALTGLPNRRAFMAYFQHLFAAMNRYRRPLSLLHLDLDRFAAFNAAHGQQHGDAALRAVADLLRSRIRTADILGRLDQEDFAILLPETDQAGAMVLAERIRAAVAVLEIPGMPEVHLTCSIGVVECVPRAERNPGQVLNLADKALLKAKQEGRNQVALFKTAELTPSER